MTATENMTSFWASLIVEELVRNGIAFFCISPGSRSTPLTVAAAKNPKARCTICHDERAAAFMALGYAKATGTPAALICTSGTAAANYYPAIIEASMDAVPMIILTADRPPELLNTAANQTIHQHNIYGEYTRWHFTLPAPSEKISPRFVLTTIDQAVFRTRHTLPGPVHVNCMFREPLEPALQSFSFPQDSAFEHWQKSEEPFTSYAKDQGVADDKNLTAVSEITKNSKNGLVIIGRLDIANQNSDDIAELLNTLGWPVYADIASGFRLGQRDWPPFDERLLYAKKIIEQKLDTVLHIGGTFICKQVQQWLEKNPPHHYIHIHQDPRRVDPGHIVTTRIVTEPSMFCRSLKERMKQNAPLQIKSFTKLSNTIQRAVEKELSIDSMNEPAIALVVSRFIPAQHGLFIGNSMPVRDMGAFAAFNGPAIPIATNRGASGIDGNIATAVGFANGLQRPVTIILGDVAALHDLNSLNLVRNSGFPIILIIVNNDGGGIFSFLPIAQHKDVFDTYFTTPHGLSFRHAAKMFHLLCAQPASLSEFRHIYKKACAGEESLIIEVKTDRAENLRLHQDIQQKIQTIVDANL